MSWFARWFGRPSVEEKTLLQRCRGDAEQMERLIAYEQSRRPQLTRSRAAASAVDRLRRD